MALNKCSQRVFSMSKLKGTLPEGALLDAEDLSLLAGYHWYITKEGYVETGVKGVPYRYLHRLVLKATKGQMVDHINGNRADNRKNNLRLCNKSTNAMNMSKIKPSKYSKYRGVTYNKRNKRWTMQITKNYKMVASGAFSTEVEAAKAYDVAAKQHFGEFANPNFKE